ncbi:MAG TPA: hypothetical protein DIS79_06520 [Bacteroidetes bacterium]|nr:hypothetical protein [Bacteroidota bacterium]HRK04379.1 hypothetical protein [Chlorobiota bacterium]
MNHRLLLMFSGLLMMFALFGAVMMLGGLVNDAESWTGNSILSGIFTILALVVFRIAMSVRKKNHVRINAEIDRQMSELGYVEAALIADRLKMTVDETRDMLDMAGRHRRWRRDEMPEYNARYFPTES